MLCRAEMWFMPYLINMERTEDIMEGCAGTGVLMLPSGFHCGGAPKGRRLLSWVRYGTHANRAYVNDRIQPVHVAGREVNDLTRLVLK